MRRTTISTSGNSALREAHLAVFGVGEVRIPSHRYPVLPTQVAYFWCIFDSPQSTHQLFSSRLLSTTMCTRKYCGSSSAL